ncbi:two-component system regulatory protein YycI [Alicyclobacillus tolerans]|uniref:two-component system regulatory protein YycI n=1 Tax=Alicyclobacillus tolerans TaxID=90970 RepID=UPI001F2FFB77|nr:two-component system regulatory protein YycI [Alicyclobacillus tolerans]MCF8565675.1 two-component system regulatory protein YycI [Alicyclobacillus tolerans]
MNWETAKTWLIAAFFILDLVLGWQLYQGRQEIIGYTESYSDLLANTKTLLAEHGFSLDAAVPTTHPDMPSLHADPSAPDLKSLAHDVFPQAKSVTVDPTTQVASTASGKVKYLGSGQWQVSFNKPVRIAGSSLSPVMSTIWHGTDYVSDPVLSQSDSMAFLQAYNGYPIFDAPLWVDVSGNNVMGYTQSAIANISPVGQAKPIISALDALDSLANVVDKSTSSTDNRILRVDLGYARKAAANPSPNAAASTYWFPVWRVVTTGQVYFVNALTGEVETSSGPF